MGQAELINDQLTLATQNVGTTAVDLLAATIAAAALHGYQETRVMGWLISNETQAIRLGDATVSTTKGPLFPAGTVMFLPKSAGTLWACATSGTAVVNITLALR